MERTPAVVATTTAIDASLGGFPLTTILSGFISFKGKTQHLSFTDADKLSINLSNFIVGYEKKNGTYFSLNKMSNVFLQNVINEISSNNVYTIEKENILIDFEKLKNNTWAGIGETQHFDVIVKRLFLWLFLNFDKNRPETFSQIGYATYNRLIGYVGREAGINCGLMEDDGKISEKKSTIVSKAENFLTDLFYPKQETATTGTTETENYTIYYIIGVAVFLVIVLLIFKK